jgi:hypothetical protein
MLDELVWPVGPKKTRQMMTGTFPLLSESLPGAFGPAFAFVLALAFALVLAFAIFSDIKGVAAARSVFGGHVTVLLE